MTPNWKIGFEKFASGYGKQLVPREQYQHRNYRQPETQQFPEHTIKVANQGWRVRKTAVAFNDLATRKLERRMAEPRSAAAHNSVICDRANTEQNIFRQPLPARYNYVIAQKSIRAKLSLSKPYSAAMNLRPAKINAIGEKALAPDFNQFGHDINDGADLALTAYLHSGQPQPDGPHQRAAEPLARRMNNSRF